MAAIAAAKRRVTELEAENTRLQAEVKRLRAALAARNEK